MAIDSELTPEEKSDSTEYARRLRTRDDVHFEVDIPRVSEGGIGWNTSPHRNFSEAVEKVREAVTTAEPSVVEKHPITLTALDRDDTQLIHVLFETEVQLDQWLQRTNPSQ